MKSLRLSLAAAVVGSLGLASTAIADARSDVAAALADGRYAEAATAAQSETDPAIRAGLLSQVAAAQTATGTPIARTPRVKPTLPEVPQLGGGSGADFGELIQLIQNQTGGPEAWEALGGTGGTIDSFESGVRVDATGLLERARRLDQRKTLAELKRQVRVADLDAAMQEPTPRRFVSLTDLEAKAAAAIAAGEPIPETVRHLGGLTRIEYLLTDDQTGELLLGGPAEGWGYDAAARAIGTASGAPILNLDDLVVVLRAMESSDAFGCSIDPRAENIAAMQQVVAASAGRPLRPGQTRRWAGELEDALGRQDISIHGVPADSRVARVMVEADYRMKLIGADEIDAPAIPSYFDLLAANPEYVGGATKGLRWWLTVDVDAIQTDEAGRNFELTGCSVRCQSENQLLEADGSRTSTGQAEPMNRAFAEAFTEHYAELAADQPVFADLQGIFDLSLVAAIIDRDGLDEAIGWDRGVFATGGAYESARYQTPAEVESVVAYRVYPGGKVVVQAAGGVSVPAVAITREADREVSPRVEGIRKEAVDAAGDKFYWNAR